LILPFWLMLQQPTCPCACARFGVVRKHAHVIVEDSKVAEVLSLSSPGLM
jgi:hypothetical protein